MGQKGENSNLVQFEPLIVWSEKSGHEKLAELYKEALRLADGTIGWYHFCRSKKGHWSKTIRVIAIILFVASTLMPYIAAMNTSNTVMLYIGYILAGLGGGLLLFDRYYGFSNSWIRFVLTGIDLENLRNAFVKNWQILYLNQLPLTKEGFATLITALMRFQEGFNATVRSETDTWAKEFQQSLSELATALKNQSESIKGDLEEQRKESLDVARSNPDKPSRPVAGTDIILEAYETKRVVWKETYHLVAVSLGKKLTAGKLTETDCIVLSPAYKLTDGDYIAIPPFLEYLAKDGVVYHIPTDVRATGGMIKASAALLCDDSNFKVPGCSIARKDTASVGTLGLKVYKGGISYMLSCYHVLCAAELNAETYTFSLADAIGDLRVTSPGGSDDGFRMELGKVEEGYFSNRLDCALARVNDPDVRASICRINTAPDTPMEITSYHAQIRYPVQSVGRTSGLITGRIQYARTSCDIHYRINNQWTIMPMEELIWTDQLSNGGDSGAAVVDHQQNVIGIIIGCSENHTFILPIGRIMDKLNISLTKN